MGSVLLIASAAHIDNQGLVAGFGCWIRLKGLAREARMEATTRIELVYTVLQTVA